MRRMARTSTLRRSAANSPRPRRPGRNTRCGSSRTATTCVRCRTRRCSMTDSTAQSTFDRGAIRAFRFRRCEFDAGSGEARLIYAFDDGPELIETIRFPDAPYALDDARATAVEQA